MASTGGGGAAGLPPLRRAPSSQEWHAGDIDAHDAAYAQARALRKKWRQEHKRRTLHELSQLRERAARQDEEIGELRDRLARIASLAASPQPQSPPAGPVSPAAAAV